jgi:hypothetical protein
MAVESPSLRLTVWRACSWKQDYLNLLEGGCVEKTNFAEEIYSWRIYEDLYGSIDSEKAENIRLSFEEFDPASLNFVNEEKYETFFSAFSIKKLQQPLKVIDSVLSASSESGWVMSKTSERISSSARIQLCQHPLLALRHHLQWIYDTFNGTPNTSITIR